MCLYVAPELSNRARLHRLLVLAIARRLAASHNYFSASYVPPRPFKSARRDRALRNTHIDQDIVCPLRYVVAAVSLVVRLVMMMMRQDPAEDDDAKARADHSIAGQMIKSTRRSTLGKLMDLFTGRYLYEVWTRHVGGEEEEQERAQS